MNNRAKKIFKIFILIIFISLAVFEYSKYKINDLQIIFFDIGQGDSILVRTPGRHNILIDGGKPKSVNDKNLSYKFFRYLPFFDMNFDMLISSHPHLDHIGGLIDVTNTFPVNSVLHSGVAYDSKEYDAWINLIKQKDIEENIAQSNQRYVFKSKRGDVTIDVIYPFSSIEGKEVNDVNDYSVVFYLTYKDKKIIFTGDISDEVEKVLEEKGYLEEVDLLKVAHQGSDTSTSKDFLEVIDPDYAVIMVGENSYGHPSPRILKRLERAGATIIRTDLSGDIVFYIDKNGNLILKQ